MSAGQNSPRTSIKSTKMSDRNDIVTDLNPQDDERISAYLRGEMSSEEEAAFLADVRHDEALRSKAVAMAYLAKAMKSVGQRQDAGVEEALLSISKHTAEAIAMKTVAGVPDIEITASPMFSVSKPTSRVSAEYNQSVAEEMPPEYSAEMELEESSMKAQAMEEKRRGLKKERRVPRRKHILKYVAVAASVAVLCVVGIKFYSYRMTTGLGNEYGSLFVSETSVVRGVKNAAEAEELVGLYMDVQEGVRLKAAIKRLSVLWELSTMEIYNDYTDEASLIGWNLAIACLKDNDKAGARSTLSKLIDITDTDSIIHQKAVELNAKL